MCDDFLVPSRGTRDGGRLPCCDREIGSFDKYNRLRALERVEAMKGSTDKVVVRWEGGEKKKKKKRKKKKGPRPRQMLRQANVTVKGLYVSRILPTAQQAGSTATTTL